MRIKKISGTAVLQGNIVDSLNSNSSLNAPSIRAVNEGLGNIKGKILWTNPNPTTDITKNTTITLSSDDYDMLEIHFRQTTTDERCYAQRVKKGVNTRIFAPTLIGSSVAIQYRNINRNSDTSYTIATISTGGYNNYIIPTRIVGYKKGLFDNTATQTASEEPSSDESIVSDETIFEEPTI